MLNRLSTRFEILPASYLLILENNVVIRIKLMKYFIDEIVLPVSKFLILFVNLLEEFLLIVSPCVVDKTTSRQFFVEVVSGGQFLQFCS